MRFNYKSQLIEFKPRFVPLVSFFLALGILISMSSWQFKRLKWKESLINLRVSNFEKIPEQLDSFKEPSKNEFRKANIKGTLLNLKTESMLKKTNIVNLLQEIVMNLQKL